MFMVLERKSEPCEVHFQVMQCQCKYGLEIMKLCEEEEKKYLAIGIGEVISQDH